MAYYGHYLNDYLPPDIIFLADPERVGSSSSIEWFAGPAPVADIRSLTHYGEPYDGNTRYFRSTLFVAAVRSCYDESCLLHGVDWMPPKVIIQALLLGYDTMEAITEEQMLKFMGCNTYLTPVQAKMLLEVSLLNQTPAPTSVNRYSLIGVREHIKKRPPLATTEKVQQFVRGEEGALSMTTRLRSPNASKGLPVNYCSGFRSLDVIPTQAVDGVSRESYNIVVNAMDYGFEPSDTPRTDRSITRNIELGLAALRGEKGPAYDRIVLNAGMVDHLLGCDGAEDITAAMDRAREAIDSGKALNRLLSYIKKSNRVT
ncbi:UNVERIFIED_CONTAM: hypothetical protein Sradi_6753300 [Sesamum radiatum]|uniref:Anthranilate phosphoribosyltransferase n=1 Tax=Sesamum radiatum TaxID=300843 RepID=A0AAW2JR70_SESRA